MTCNRDKNSMRLYEREGCALRKTLHVGFWGGSLEND